MSRSPEVSELPASLLDRGRELRLEGRLDEALDCFVESLRLDPACARAHAGYGATLAKMGHYHMAMEAYWQCLRLQQLNPRVYAALADLYLQCGRAEPAVDCFRQAVLQAPTDENTHGNLLYTLNFDSRCSPEDIFREHLKYGGLHGSMPSLPPPTRRRKGPIRIGYTSGDFCNHAVVNFFEPILNHHRRDLFEITLYSSTPNPDFVSERLQKPGHAWRDVSATSDEDMADIVRRDGIDILVDLSGHTSVARLGVFGRRPAPVQVNYLGYPNTTGLAAMDYRITDAWADPPGMTEQWHTERLVRLPRGFLCYQPPEGASEVSEAPCIRAGSVTFGSFSKPLKWSARAIEAWAAILRRVPDSRLLLHQYRAGPGSPCVFESFLSLGVSPHRIQISGSLDGSDHWDWFHQVDLALDPFPYNGTTASCETLWMGVPLVTLAGCSHVSRVGASLLTRLGLDALIARTPEEYVELAAALAATPLRLSDLRAGMRARMLGSTLMDGPGFTRDLEAAYQELCGVARDGSTRRGQVVGTGIP
jgi:predicted O-linked N-acetylglucosamine transferase (SPINDLY family)